MGLLQSLQRLWNRPEPQAGRADTRHPSPASEPEVPEIAVTDLRRALQSSNPPLLLDCREVFERRQARIPDSLFIPMNEMPARLDELDPAAEYVVYCAHGNRSYGVASFLIEHGFEAHSLAGGIVQWQVQGGRVESDYRPGA